MTAGDLIAVDVSTRQGDALVTTASIEGTTPVVTPETVYVADTTGVVSAVDRTDGSIDWQFEPEFGLPWLNPTFAHDTVFVSMGGDGSVVAIDAATGSVEWIDEIRYATLSPPVVADGLVVVTSRDDRAHAFDAHTGERRWRSERIDPTPMCPATIVGGSVVIFGDYPDTTAYILDGSSGEIEHTMPIGEGAPEAAAPIVVDGVAYVGVLEGDGRIDVSGTVYAIDLPIDGSSEDARVQLGTHGHHHTWTGDTAAAVDRLAGDGVLGVATGSTVVGSGMLGAGYIAWKHRDSIFGRTITTSKPD